MSVVLRDSDLGSRKQIRNRSEEGCSGIRLGTQEVTQIGMGYGMMAEIARLIEFCSTEEACRM